jgi:SAM-dependent methyltransferase
MSPLDRFLEELRTSLEAGTFVKVMLSAPRELAGEVRRVRARIVELREGRRVSFEWQSQRQTVTKNFEPGDAGAEVGRMLGSEFAQAQLFTIERDWHWRGDVRDRGGGALKASRPAITTLPPPGHDRRKARAVPAESAFLQALGVTNARGEPRPGMAGKVRQIERFTELLGHLVDDSPLRERREVRVVDMGAGKGYLTFATYEFFRARSVAAEVTGIEQRGELVELANGVARDVGFAGLKFVRGAIGEAAPAAIDVLIALHACDTATDDALHQGVCAGASLIIASPCCHKEVRAQSEPPAVLREVWRHGILREREAEIVTDALRALLLEIHGYQASVFEFISPEHTGKNLMIAAQRRAQPLDPAPARARLRELLEFYGIREQRLARLLSEL